MSGLADVIRQGLRRMQQTAPKPPEPEPELVDTSVWMPLSLAESWLGRPMSEVETLVRRGLIRTHEPTDGTGRRFAMRADVERLMAQSVVAIRSELEGTNVLVVPADPAARDRNTLYNEHGQAITLEPTTQQTEQATEWKRIPSPFANPQ